MADRETIPDEEQASDEEFWRLLAAGELRVQRCTECGRRRWPTGPYCPDCGSRSFEWARIEPAGTIWSHTTYHHAFDKRFAADVPYTVALVELDDEVRMIGRLRAGRGAIGDRVRLVLDDAAAQRRFLEWEVE